MYNFSAANTGHDSGIGVPRPELPPGKTVMIVDDQVTIRRIVASYFSHQACSHPVEQAFDGATALMSLRINIERIGLVVSDWEMSPVTGLQFLRLLRADKDERFRNMSFLMLADRLTEPQIRLAMTAGVDALLAKEGSALANDQPVPPLQFLQRRV
ncbi:MAG: response regulator [Desulfovibrio sp.]|uniref:response regulator n=1 Tax=Desulfovibrio sp. TaxID=885 RepID=UPI00135E4C34|nr:response regulator [Desulfovibrio sp.]MTJ94215.1 response regulator [Desulfovibrio sp.]